jgi:hypothetical protein
MIPTTGLPVDASPFSVTYEPIGEDPTEAQFDDAERITREYLEQFFVDFFEFSFEGEYVSLSVGVLDNTVGPPRIDYNLTAFFLPGAQTIPTEDEVDIVVQTAFSQPSVQTLILELRTLPLENPFSSTTTVSYSITEPMAAPLTTSSDSTGITVPAVLVGLATGVGALACIVTAIFAARRRSQYRSIKQSLLPGMPYNSNIMAFMDRELATSRSFSSSQSSRTLPLHRNEIWWFFKIKGEAREVGLIAPEWDVTISKTEGEARGVELSSRKGSIKSQAWEAGGLVSLSTANAKEEADES